MKTIHRQSAVTLLGMSLLAMTGFGVHASEPLTAQHSIVSTESVADGVLTTFEMTFTNSGEVGLMNIKLEATDFPVPVFGDNTITVVDLPQGSFTTSRLAITSVAPMYSGQSVLFQATALDYTGKPVDFQLVSVEGATQ